VAERVEEAEVVIRRRGGRDGREAAEIEVARIEDDAADGVAVAANEFGRRIEDNRRAVLDGTAEVGRGEGVVDDERNLARVGQGGELFQVEDCRLSRRKARGFSS
jgi:hypothetical protein